MHQGDILKIENIKHPVLSVSLSTFDENEHLILKVIKKVKLNRKLDYDRFVTDFKKVEYVF